MTVPGGGERRADGFEWPRSRVGEYARRVGELLEQDEDTLAMLESAGTLHDAGKRLIADDVMDKPGPLTDAEWNAMRMHPELGAGVASDEGHGDEVAEAIRHHHERVDGAGYPAGMRGSEIPLGARILFVIDAYLAMTSARPWRAAMRPDRALAELERCAGEQFDAEVVEVFARLVRANL
jgi:HD-GYP domain-containing protein (c-di-GMP phosphodiesterase class II)